MKIETAKLEKVIYGWNMIFNVFLSDIEEKNFDPTNLQYDGSYEYIFHGNQIIVSCDFPKEELYPDEDIELRINLIKEDILARINENIKSF